MVKQQKTSSSQPIGNRRIRGFRASAQSGQAIVLMALAMVGLIAFVGLAIDGGRYFEQRRASQNASDMAALGGLFVYSKASDPTTVQDKDVLKEINRIAEINLIKDTDGTLGNEVNANVKAWWIDANGAEIRAIGITGTAPANTSAVKVFTQIPYQTFFAGMFGWSNMTAQSDGIARINLSSTPPFTDMTSDAWVGGSTCDNLTDRIAHNYSNTNTAKFISGVYVDGSLAVGSVNATDFNGNVEVRSVAGNGDIDGPYSPVSPTTNNPITISSGSNKFNDGAQYIPPSGKPPKGFPNWAYPGGDRTKPLIDAMAFKPGTGYFYNMYKKVLGQTEADKFYHTITGGVAGVEAAYSAGKRGIYWIDGDLTVTAGSTEWQNVTFILTGTFESQDNNHEFFTAGPRAMNISVLAGKDRGGALRCASSNANWVFKVAAQRNIFNGLIYVPYGESYFAGNTTGGVDFSKGVITYSFYLGSDSDQAQSWQFNFDPTLLVQPALTTELNK
jgi:hypothetical protein